MGGPAVLVWFVYLVILNVTAIALAIMTRDVPSVAGESSSIIHVSFFTLFAMVILALVFFVDSIKADLKIFLISFVVFWVSVCYLALIIFRKTAWINHSAQEIKTLFLGEKQDCTLYSTPATTNASPSHTSALPSTDVTSTSKGDSQGVTEPAEHSIDMGPRTQDSPVSMPMSVQRFGDSVASDVTVAVDFSEADEKRKAAFLIATADGWEEYVDRSTGESFWVHTATGKVV